jgi:hypothetical protein
MNLNSYQNRSKFIKKLIFWIILVGGILALIFSYTQSGNSELGNILLNNINVKAQSSTSGGGVRDVCKDIGGCLSGVDKQGGGSDGIAKFVVRLAQNMVFVMIALSIAAIVWGGFIMVTSNGEEEKYAQGLRILQYAISGVVLGILSFTIIYLVTVLVPNLNIF